MAVIGASSLSVLCLAVESFVRSGLDTASNNIDVTVGAPAIALNSTLKMNRINLFFNRFEPSGYGANGHPGEPWLMRMFCLITAFGQDDEAESITAGEFELRMIGEVIRLFHETPVLPLLDVNGESVRLQAVFQPLNYESLNQLWSTQNDASFRPSVAYEFSLGPIVPSVRKPFDKKVSSLGTVIEPGMDKTVGSDDAIVRVFPAAGRDVDVSLVHWEPAICFVVDGECQEALQYKLSEVDLDATTVNVWLAGKAGTDIAFKWLIWDSAEGWTEEDPEETATPQTETINPQGQLPESLISLSLPLDSEFAGSSAQVQLVAERTYTDPIQEVSRTVRSNPLLITFYS